MSWEKGFRGVGAAAKKDAQRALRAEREVAYGAGQDQSAHNASIDAVVGIVAMLASQYPFALIEGESGGTLDENGGTLTFSVRIRPAREADLESEDGEEKTTATDSAPVAESTTEEEKKNEPPKSNGPSGAAITRNAAAVPVPAGNAKPVPQGQDGSTPVRGGNPANTSGSKPSGGAAS